MNRVTLCFHGRITFFLPGRRCDVVVEHEFNGRASIKDMVESLGPPHPEVELLLVDGVPVDFDFIVPPGAHIDVYSRFDAVTVPGRIALRPALTGVPAFVLDTHLGRLANYLRMLGFDTLYRNDYPDEELAQVSASNQRILLTRDTGLLKRSIVVYGYYVRATDPRKQIVEVARRYDLLEQMAPFHRCIKCNGLLQPVEKADIIDQLPGKSAQVFQEYRRCQDCGKLYWKGSHYQRMQALIEQVVASVASPPESVTPD